MPDVVNVERRGGGAAWVTIERPEARNALSGEVLRGLEDAAIALGKDPAVRAVVFTGAGDKAFSSGADLKERRGMSEQDTLDRIELIGRCFTRISRLPKLTICAMNGSAYGGGLELALSCDVRIAVEGCEMGLTEVRLGIMPGAGGTQRLPRLIGAARAKEMILLGKRIPADQAQAFGLVNQVVPREGLVAAVDAMVAELAGVAPVSLAMAKQAIDRGIDTVLDEGLRIEESCYKVTLTTEDRNEGLRAFAEKRPPRYQGR